MSESDNGGSQPRDNSGEAVPALNIHPKLMTTRTSTSNPGSARQHTPRSARDDVLAAVPSNSQLADAGVPPEDGVVRQLSARKHEPGALAGPRPVSAVSSARQSGAVTPRRQPQPQQQQPQQQPSRRAPHTAGSRGSLGASREPIRPGRTTGHSPFRSPSKHSDPYAHVTSVVHEYTHNNMTALEAQYKSVRSHSAAASQVRDHRSASRQVTERDESATTREAQTPRSVRQGSPQPRSVNGDYLRGGVPRAALDAPHIRYADALENMYKPRASPRVAGGYTPSTSSADRVPQVAQYIPERYKYVEASDEDKQRRKAETLRLLEQWRENQKARAENLERQRAPSPAGKAAQPSATKRTASAKSRAQPAVRQPESQAAVSYSHPAATHAEERPEWDSTFEPGFGEAPPTPRGGARSPRTGSLTPRVRRQSGSVSARKNRKPRGRTPSAVARGDGEVNPNAFRRKLLFEVAAPSVFSA